MVTEGRTMRDELAAEAAAVTLTLRRISDSDSASGTFTGTITDAVVGRTVFRREEQGNVRIEFGERDYLIPVSSYTFTGLGTVEPKVRDRFVESIGGTDYTFEIQPIPGEQAWRYTDGSLTRYRIHVKRVVGQQERR